MHDPARNRVNQRHRSLATAAAVMALVAGCSGAEETDLTTLAAEACPRVEAVVSENARAVADAVGEEAAAAGADVEAFTDAVSAICAEQVADALSDEAAVATTAEITEAAEPTPTGVATPTPEPTSTQEPTPTQQPVPGGVPEDTQPAVVERVVDGDTIWVRVDEPGGPLPAGAAHNIRLLEIDTPETRHPQRGQECWGPQATQFTARQLPVGSTVYLQADQEDSDRYGRYLRYVWTQDGTFFNEQAIRQGYARAALYEPNDRHIARMRRAERQAHNADRGMWGPPCDYDAPVPQPEPQPEPEPEPGAGGGCEAGYDPCVPAFPPDVNCGDVNGPISVTGADPHELDGDGDGVACEG